LIFELVMLTIAILLLLGVIASKASYKLGVPALLLFLIIGMLAGSEGIVGIEFDDAQAAQMLGVVALAYILFAGGLDTQWKAIRPVLRAGAALATVGVLLTALIVGMAAFWLFDFSLMEALLLGAIVSSTDAAAVFMVLRSKSLHLRGRLKPLLELESGSNDPIAVLLTVGLISLLTQPQTSLISLIPFFTLQVLVGGAIGLGVGRSLVFVLNRLHLEYDGLYSVLTLSAVLLTYGTAVALEGNGFLAVYLAGLVMGKYDFVHKRSLVRFHDGIAWLMQIAMFLVLGLLVFPSQLLPVAAMALALSLVLIFVARPVAVFLTLLFYKMPLNEKGFISWVGLKGAVPIVIATFPVLAGVSQADFMFNIVFFVVLTSVLIQGTSIPLVARVLRVEEKPQPAMPDTPEPDVVWEPLSVSTKASRQQEIHVPANSPVARKQIVEAGFPPNALVIALQRDGRTMIPSGSTTLLPGDRLLMVVEEAVDAVRSLLHAGDGAALNDGSPSG
jgi:cell volume regulation protein A